MKKKKIPVQEESMSRFFRGSRVSIRILSRNIINQMKANTGWISSQGFR